MDSVRLGALVFVDSAPREPAPARPAKAVPRIYPAMPQDEDDFELEPLQRETPDSTPEGRATLGRDLEASRPGTPTDGGDATEVVQTAWDPYMNRFRVLAACSMNFGNGLNDSAVGALIPYIEKQANASPSSIPAARF